MIKFIANCAPRTRARRLYARIYDNIMESAIVLAAELSMASGLLRSMLSYILTDSTFTGVSERSKLALQQTEDLLNKVSEEAYIDRFHGFAVQLVTALESLCDVSPMSGTSKTVAAQREMLWKVFHEKRLTELPELWKHFFASC